MPSPLLFLGGTGERVERGVESVQSIQRRDRGCSGVVSYRQGERGRWWPVLPSMATEVTADVSLPQGGDKEEEGVRQLCWRHSGARGTLQQVD